MKSKRTLIPCLIALLGIAMLFGSSYIMGEVDAGRGKLSSAQQQVDRSQGLFGSNPVTKEIGKGITSSAQRKIDAYGKEADRYAEIASWLKIGGIVFIVVGIGAFFKMRKK